MAKRFEQAKKYTQKYKDVLLPCKWCGNTDIRIVSDRSMFPAEDCWSVVCTTEHCDSSGMFKSVKDAVDRWNRNQSSPLPPWRQNG